MGKGNGNLSAIDGNGLKVSAVLKLYYVLPVIEMQIAKYSEEAKRRRWKYIFFSFFPPQLRVGKFKFLV